MQTALRQMMRRFIRMVPGAVGLVNLGAAGIATLEKKAVPSSRRALVALVLLVGAMQASAAINLSPAETRRIGNKIWQNECGGTVSGLTSWNAGENFASLGIGHFIWYPRGVDGPFEESFPKLVKWLKAEQVLLPAWLLQADSCPWPDRKSFEADHDGPRQKELRSLLS